MKEGNPAEVVDGDVSVDEVPRNLESKSGEPIVLIGSEGGCPSSQATSVDRRA